MINSILEEKVASVLQEMDCSYELQNRNETTYFYFPIQYNKGEGRALAIIFFNKAPILSMRVVLKLPLKEGSAVADSLRVIVNRINNDLSFFRVYLNSSFDIELAADFELIDEAEELEDIITFYTMVMFSLPEQIDNKLKDLIKFIMDLEE